MYLLSHCSCSAMNALGPRRGSLVQHGQGTLEGNRGSHLYHASLCSMHRRVEPTGNNSGIAMKKLQTRRGGALWVGSVPYRNAGSLSATKPSFGSQATRRPTQAFRFMKALGLKKPGFLPDFGKEKRKNLLMDFFSHPGDRNVYDKYLADDCTVKEEKNPNIVYPRSQYIDLMNNRIVPAIPDFTWTPSTDGAVDDEGYAIVEVQAAGHHTGISLEFPNLEPIPPSGKRFRLQPARVKVKIDDGKIHEIVALKTSPGPLALYEELGGKIPQEMQNV